MPENNRIETLRRMQEKWGMIPNIPLEDLDAAAEEGRIRISQPSSLKEPITIKYFPPEEEQQPAFGLPGFPAMPESMATIPFMPMSYFGMPVTSPEQLPQHMQAGATPSVIGGTPTPLPPREEQGPEGSAGTITFHGEPGQPFTDPGTFEVMKGPSAVEGGDFLSRIVDLARSDMIGTLGRVDLLMGKMGIHPEARVEGRLQLASRLFQEGVFPRHLILPYVKDGVMGLAEPMEKQYQIDVAMGKMGVSELTIDRHAESIARNRFDQKGYGYKGILFKYEGGEVFKPNVKKDKKAMQKYQNNELVEGKHYEVYPLSIGKAGGPSMMPRAPGGGVSQASSVAQQDLERAGR